MGNLSWINNRIAREGKRFPQAFRLLFPLLLAMLISLDQPAAAQSPSPTLGIRWALWTGQPLSTLTYTDQPDLPQGLLLVTGPDGAAAIDPQRAAVIWRLDRSIPEQPAGPPLRGNTLFVSSMALDIVTGEPIWHLPNGDQGPLLLIDDTLYLAGHLATLAINPQNGAILWQIPPVDQGPMLADDQTLYIIGQHEVWALARQNGAILWHTAIDSAPMGEPIILEKTLLVRQSGHRFQAFDVQTGQAWTLPFDYLMGHHRAASVIYGFANDPDTRQASQLVAFGLSSQQTLWRYPQIDANGIYLQTPLFTDPKPFIDNQHIYIFDRDERVVALDPADGTRRWVSTPLARVTWPLKMVRLGEGLVIATPADHVDYMLDRASGKVQEAVFWGELVGDVPDTVMLEKIALQLSREGIPDLPFDQFGENLEMSRLILRQAPGGQLLLDNLVVGQTAPDTISAEPPVPMVAAEEDHYYFAHGQYVYAIGPAAPAEAVEAARRFLAQGDYHSASRTLSLLKNSDEADYMAHDGPTVAADILNTWLAEADDLSVENLGALSDFISTPDFRYAVGMLQIREALAHLQYLHAYVRLDNRSKDCQAYCPPVDELPEVIKMRQQYGDTVWAAQLESLLPTPIELQMLPAVVDEPGNVRWYALPIVLPAIIFLIVMGINRRRALYPAAVTAVLSSCGGLSYFYWANSDELERTFQQLTCGLNLALVGSVALMVWLLTHHKGYVWMAIGLSLVFILART